MKDENREALRLLHRIGTIVISCLAIILVVWVSGWNRYRRLTSDGREITGIVTARLPQEHRSIEYLYKVGQEKFVALGRAGNGNPEFDTLQVNDTVKVYYDPDDPAVSCMGYPSKYFRQANTGIVFMLVALIVYYIIVLGKSSGAFKGT